MNDNDRSIVGLVMVAHAMVHTYELSVPILVSVWIAEFDVSAAVIGGVVTVGYALFGLGALPGGIVADRVGSRRLIAACLAGMGGAFLFLSAATGPVTVALALLVWGAAASVYHPSGLSLISRGVDERGTAFAYHGMAGNFGIAAGPLVTAALLTTLDWRTTVAVLAVPAAVAAAYALRVDLDERAAVEADGGTGGRQGAGDEDPGGDASGTGRSGGDGSTGVASLAEFLAGSKALFAGAFVLVFGVVVASGLYYRGVLTFMPEILTDLDAFGPVEVAGVELEPSRYVYVGVLVVGMAGQYVGGRLTDRVRPERAIAVAFGTLAVLALAFLPAARAGAGPFLAVAAVLGFVLFLAQPVYQATVAELTPAGTHGLSYGYTYLGVFGVGAAGGAVAGAVLTYLSPAALFAVLAADATAGALLGVALTRRTGTGQR